LETRILKGKPVAAAIKESVAARALALTETGREPRLAVVLAGEDPGSRIYTRSIERAAGRVGVAVEVVEPGADPAEVAGAVRRLAADARVHGIIVQRPLPEGVPESVIEEVPVRKDVDGATTASLGLLFAGRESYAPCTAQAVVEMLAASGVETPGRHVVIVGRSAVVGRPLAALLLRKSDLGNATVTVCHSRTLELERHAGSADILVVAIGRAAAVGGDAIPEGGVVIDVGINEVDDPTSESGRSIVGDVAFEEALGRAAAITPVPGGVGSLTTALLLRNTVDAAERSGDG
jgi:methylenetetrahydrofolate dehydrogenase (NADP+)/methenyltetrahydrofolate cyclohydrolase